MSCWNRKAWPSCTVRLSASARTSASPWARWAKPPGRAEAQDIEKVVAGTKMMIRPNIFCNVEYSFYPEGAELEEGLDETLFLLLSVSF